MIAYLAGTSSNDQKIRLPTIWACDFNSGFSVRAKDFIGDEAEKTPVVMKRIPSYEILVIGCFKNLILMEYDITNQKFIKLAKVPNLHSDYIVDIAIKGEKIYSKGIKEKFVKITEFGPKVTQSLLANPMFTSVLQSQLQSPIAATSQLPSNLPDERIRYRQSQISRIPVNTAQSLEKIALSKTARMIYVGGGAGINMLKYNDQSQQYQLIPNQVEFCHSELRNSEVLRYQEYS